MNKTLSTADVKMIMHSNFIGINEIRMHNDMKLKIPQTVPKIQFSAEELNEKKDDYLLILGIDEFEDGRPVTIRNLIKLFGKDPEANEPCFYNQDWYEQELFIDLQMENKWFLIRKNVYEKSRAAMPDELIKEYTFPSAIKCCYTFFVEWLCSDVKLWYHDFVWCSDLDHNGDRIYVGKYNDIDGINKNGFSIHRHLGLRDCYGCID